MLRDRRPLGAITVARRGVRPFTDQQIELLQTFGDQAVIAIENVRLFKELQSSNRELTEVLLANGAHVNVRAGNNQSPLDLALSTGREEIAALLEQLGATLQ